MFFNEKRDLVVDVQPNQYSYIPEKQINVILDNYYKGVPWPQVSPLYPITREQLAFIITHPKTR